MGPDQPNPEAITVTGVGGDVRHEFSFGLFARLLTGRRARFLVSRSISYCGTPGAPVRRASWSAAGAAGHRSEPGRGKLGGHDEENRGTNRRSALRGGIDGSILEKLRWFYRLLGFLASSRTWRTSGRWRSLFALHWELRTATFLGLVMGSGLPLFGSGLAIAPTTLCASCWLPVWRRRN
jgi:hypothetical protein